MLATDPLGRTREQPEVPTPAAYYHAFDAMASDPSHELVVMEIVGTLQLTTQGEPGSRPFESR